MTKRSLLALAVVLALSACASSSASTVGQGTTSAPVKLTVLAAASLAKVFQEIGIDFTRAHPGVTFAFSFAGTDELAAQIQQGAPADVFAGASTRYGDQLTGSGSIRPYRVFCTNRLVLVTPDSNPAGITSLRDLATKPVRLVIGSDTLPVGSYTRTVLRSLDAVYRNGYASAVLGHVVSNEDSVTSILTKVEAGEADAGFVYVTDALAAGAQVKTIDLPSEAQAVATYPIAIVASTAHARAARRFVAYVLSAPGQRLLRSAGFGAPPPS